MYYVNKIVGWCMSPLGFFFVALAFSAVLCRVARFRWIGRTLAVLTVLMLWFLSCGVSLRWTGYPLEGEEIDLSTLPAAHAVVLLGGGVALHEKCGGSEIWSAADRVWAAARLIKMGKAPLVTVSGGGASAAVALLAEMGVDTSKVVSFPQARNTEEEARLIGQIIKCGAEDRPTILLVTSAWHMPRARLLFERAGFEVIPAPTDYEFHCQIESQYRVADFFPYADILERNSYAIKEWVARVCYWMKGWGW